MAATLTPKQKRFVQEYLIDLNATQAAIRSGYSEKTAGSIGQENLTKPEIAEAIAAGQSRRAERTEVTADRVLAELAKIGFSDIRKAVRWTGAVIEQVEPEEVLEEQAHGGALKRSRKPEMSAVELVSSDEVDDETAAAISEISQTTAGIRIKLHDKRAALVDMGRHLGMFKDKIEHSDPEGRNPFQGLMEAIAANGRPRPGN